MIDMHAHLSERAEEELNLRKENGIFTCFSTGTPEEWHDMQKFSDRGEILISFGIHPWYADRHSLCECMEYFGKCAFIGEIGMDSVWCDVPLNIQRKQFERQLQIASDLRKPVILHTKGQEKEIAGIIRDFPQKVCVHWYSGEEREFEKFLDLDCYFTLGPNCTENNSLNSRMLQEIPAQRMFLETDGISAVAWARGEEYADIAEIPAVLRKNLEYAARVKACSPEELEKRIQSNLKEFLK